jgi:hypothetical protein
MPKPSLLERLRAKKRMRRGPLIGLGWYSETEWARVKATAKDPERFEATFADWIRMTEETLATFRAGGANAVAVLIDADEFSSWCSANAKENDAAARAQFVSQKVQIQRNAST